jgi:hypothetical protein
LYTLFIFADRYILCAIGVKNTPHAFSLIITNRLCGTALIVCRARNTAATVLVTERFFIVVTISVRKTGIVTFMVVVTHLSAVALTIHQALLALPVLNVTYRIGGRAIGVGQALGTPSGYRIAQGTPGATVCILKTFQTDTVVRIAQRFVIVITIPVGFTGVFTFVVPGKTHLARSAVVGIPTLLAFSLHAERFRCSAVPIIYTLHTTQVGIARETALRAAHCTTPTAIGIASRASQRNHCRY